MTINLEDRVILITGAARGLGLAYAQSLHTHGATVAMHDGGVDQDGANPNPQLIRDVAKSVGEERTFAVSGLLNSRSECEQVVQAVINRYGRIDGLINNAGIVLWEDTVDVDEDTFRTSSSVNHEAAFWVTQAALKQMRKQNYGRIVLTTSSWALSPYPGSKDLTLYAQSKGAQFGFAMTLANGTGHENIRVNLIAPVANTRIYASEVEPGKLTPESVAGTVTWLVSPECNLGGKLVKAMDGVISVLEITEAGSMDLGDKAADPESCGKAIKDMLAGAKTS